MKNLRKLATGHSRDYLVTIGSLGYLKLVKSDMYPKFLKINFVVVVRHSAGASKVRQQDRANAEVLQRALATFSKRF